LKEHLGATVAYMTVSKDYPDFIEKLNRFRPRYSEQYQLPFDNEPDKDDERECERGRQLRRPYSRNCLTTISVIATALL
jgi:hypothetical protein